MTKKIYAIFGAAAPLVFLITYLIMSNLRPEYSMFTKAFSELGSLDAPNKWMWNIFGFIIPGFLVAIYSIGLFKSVYQNEGSKFPLFGLFLSGVFMSISGIFPADMNDRASTTMILHIIGSFGSYIFFLIAAFTYPKLMRKSEYWKVSVRPTLIFTYATILFGAWPFVFTSMPSLGQRLVMFFFFLWVLYTAVKLYKQPKHSQ